MKEQEKAKSLGKWLLVKVGWSIGYYAPMEHISIGEWINKSLEKWFEGPNADQRT